jgi:hypothetical protein
MGMGFPELIPQKDEYLTRQCLADGFKSRPSGQQEGGRFRGVNQSSLFKKARAGFGCKGNQVCRTGQM